MYMGLDLINDSKIDPSATFGVIFINQFCYLRFVLATSSLYTIP